MSISLSTANLSAAETVQESVIRRGDTSPRARKETPVDQHIAPIACKPWALNGLSRRLIVSHYEICYITGLLCGP